MQYLGFNELNEFLPKANKLHKMDMLPDANKKDLETIQKIESKYNIELAHERQYKDRKNKMDMNKTITIPKPFSFVDKKRENKTIAQSKLERDVEEKEKETKMLQNWQFRANPVPAYCLIPMMNTLDGKREQRRQNFIENQATKNHMKVFSFEERREKEELMKTEKLLKKWETEPFIYRAKPIPTNVSLPMYEEMVAANKLKSKQNIEKRKAQLMKLMKPPKRMMQSGEHGRRKAKDDSAIKYSYVPEINHDIPNFKKKQENFEKKMEEKKAAFEQTKPEPFTMTKKEEVEKREMAKSMSMGT